MGSKKIKYFIAGIVPYIIWGTMSIPLRGIKEFPAFQILFYRVFISIIAVWTISFLFRRKVLKADLDNFKILKINEKLKLVGLIGLSALLITGNWYTYIYGVNTISLKSAAFAYLVCPLITACCGFFILKEQLSKIKVLALLLALISIFLLATGSIFEVIWAIVIASFYALYVVTLKVIKQIDKFNLLGLQLACAGLFLMPLYFSVVHSVPTMGTFWGYISLISVLFTIIPLFLVSYALLGLPSSSLGILIYINPIVAFAVAFFYFREDIDTHQIFAYLLLLVSIIIFNTELFKKTINN